MKRWIHAAPYTGEPDSISYGKALSEGRRKRNEKFAPFTVSDTYMNSGSANSTGYRITLDDEEWILNKSRNPFDTDYELYGPFYPDEIKTWSKLFTYDPIGTYSNLNGAMTFLFENVDFDDEDDIEGATNVDYRNDDEVARSIPMRDLEFDRDVVWSIQFYEKASDLTYVREVFVLTDSYANAKQDAYALCDAWGFPKNACVVQYAYKSIDWCEDWMDAEEAGGVEYRVFRSHR